NDVGVQVARSLAGMGGNCARLYMAPDRALVTPEPFSRDPKCVRTECPSDEALWIAPTRRTVRPRRWPRSTQRRRAFLLRPPHAPVVGAVIAPSSTTIITSPTDVDGATRPLKQMAERGTNAEEGTCLYGA